MTFRGSRTEDPVGENPVTGTVGADGRWDPGAVQDPATGG
jgi:hypothetical protein